MYLAEKQKMGTEGEYTAVPYVFDLHGRAGDLASERTGQRALIAGDLLDFIGNAFFVLEGRP